MVQFEDKEDAVNAKITHVENEVIKYTETLHECREATIAFFDTIEETPAETVARGRSPPRGGQQISKMNFLLPGELAGGCSISDYNKFKRDFTRWHEASFPAGECGPTIWGTLNSKLDADWQDRLETIDGIKDSPLESIWAEMDKVMLSFHPVHTRRMEFLASKPTKNETPSHFIHSLKEQAKDARISTLSESALILHLTSSGLQQSDLNKAAKAVIIEELRKNPDIAVLDSIVAKLQGLEADHLATNDKINARKVNQEFDCKVCKKRHAKGKCAITVSYTHLTLPTIYSV